MPNDELGRELTAAELKVKTVVVIRRVDRHRAMTAWVTAIGYDYVMFSMGVIKTTLLAYLREDGKLVDDTGGEIKVWEYLGPV